MTAKILKSSLKFSKVSSIKNKSHAKILEIISLEGHKSNIFVKQITMSQQSHLSVTDV